MVGIPPAVLLVAILVAIGVWIGGEVAHGAKVVGHKTKCGVMKIVGKSCEQTKKD